jgi:hypothetical protein
MADGYEALYRRLVNGAAVDSAVADRLVELPRRDRAAAGA